MRAVDRINWLYLKTMFFQNFGARHLTETEKELVGNKMGRLAIRPISLPTFWKGTLENVLFLVLIRNGRTKESIGVVIVQI